MTSPLNGTALSVDPGTLGGKRVLVYSLGIEGRDLARFMVAHGAEVTISDTRDERALAAAGVTVPEGVHTVVTGQPLLSPAGYDLLAVSQSILRGDPAMVLARQVGVPITSQMRLFLQLCRGRIVGITGSSGKSTTTALVGAMARSAAIDHVVGGNIGEALLTRLHTIRASTLVILEISHTQLQYTDRSPHVAAITNVTANHLDQFRWDEYVGLKRHILESQSPADVAILNADDPTSQGLVPSVHGQLLRTSLAGRVKGDGAWLDGPLVAVRFGGAEIVVAHRDDVQLRGRHNLANVVMAAAVAVAAGLPHGAIKAGVREFRGVPHRLQMVGEAGGALWVDDSIATSPERTIAGLGAYNEPVVLLLGGRDKRLALDQLREEARKRCRAIVCFGEAAAAFADGMAGTARDVETVQTLEQAVATAARLACTGDVVLLSPAGTSFDAYPNFEARGKHFRDLVRLLPGFREEVPPSLQ